MSGLLLRPHHGLCIQKFTGHGYSQSFTLHMTGVVRMLRSAPETEILLTEGCDELCSCCPSNLGGVCASHHKVAKIDARVLELCGLNPGKPVAWSKLASLAGERILRANRLSAVCAGCQWLSLCLKTTTIG